jgi:tetratricopeptide (TPR) repeat protein
MTPVFTAHRQNRFPFMSTRNPLQKATSLAILLTAALPAALLAPATRAAGPIPSTNQPATRPTASATPVDSARDAVANPAANPSVAPILPRSSAVTPPIAATAASAVAPPLAASAVTAPVSPLAAFNILLVPLDSPSASASPDAVAGAGNPSVQLASGTDAAIGVGPAEAASASLRRALLRRGLNDVLTAPLDGSVVRRAVAEGRLSAQVLQQLRDAMNRVTSTASATDSAENANTASSSTPATPASTGAAPTVVAPTVVAPAVSTAIVPSVTLSAQVTEAAGAVQTASRWASRLGQSLNYRAVLVLALAPADGSGKMRYSMLLVDALRDNGEVLSFDADGANSTSAGAAPGNRLAVYEAGAAVGSTLLQQRLTAWTQELAVNRTKLADEALVAARAALAQNRVDEARDALGRVLVLDPARREALLLMGDLQLRAGDADAALSSYRRAAALEGDKGAVWTQIASAYAAAHNWPETLAAGQQALAAGLDSPALRLAMATAQIGRAQLFDAAGRSESMRDALIEAETHLRRARQMAPDDPSVLRLMSQQLTMQNRSREALQMLDRAAPQMSNDRDFQVSYAGLLSGRSGRELDAFTSWMRAWKLSGADAANNAVTGATPNNPSTQTPALPLVDRARFRRLVEGYDQLAAKMVTRAYTLTSGVVDGSISRDQAASQIKPMTTDMALANQVLKSFLPPDDRSRDASVQRLEIGDTFSQALNAYEMYVESGDDNLRDRAIEWHKDAMTRLNALRAG